MLLKITSTTFLRSVDRTSGKCLGSRSGGRSLSIDISADQGLLENGQQAALGLLALGGADVDEVVDASGCGGSCPSVSAGLEFLPSRRWSLGRRTSLTVENGEVEDVSRAAERRA
jgi:hypothetical protein